MTNDTALALAAAVAATPLVVWAARLTPGRRARARADRDLFRLARAQCSNPAQCPPCSARVEALHARLAVAEGWVDEDETPSRRAEGTAQ